MQNPQKNQEVGYVVSSRNFMVYLDGCPTIKMNDLVESESGAIGWVNSLHQDQIEVLMVEDTKITPGQLFKKIETRLSITPGDFLLGRAINPLGVPIDGRGLLSKSNKNNAMELEQPVGGIQYRQFINTQFITGITTVDSLIPIGMGQRELIMGDAHSGKTSFLIDLIVNQSKLNKNKKSPPVVCIYAAIGKPSVAVRNLIDVLSANNALTNTIIIGTSSSDTAPMIFLTPKTAFTVAEYFQKKGQDVLIILDDLGTHAKIYREISLLGDLPPGRESYPGDIFYQHAHLMERAGRFSSIIGGGSITALPVIELNLNDFTTLIPTNLMSMTDGHLLFKSSLHNQGQRPAIDISLSVSRVGRQTQNRLINSISAKVRQLLSEAEELETVSRFSSELPAKTQLILRQKKIIEEILKQEPLTFIPPQVQSILLELVFTSFIGQKDRNFFAKFKDTLIQAFLTNPKLTNITNSIDKINDAYGLNKLLEQAMPTLGVICKQG